MSDWIYFLIVLILFLLSMSVVWRKSTAPVGKETFDSFELTRLEQGIRRTITDALNQDLSKLNIRESEMGKCRNTRNTLRTALQTCGLGDGRAKDYVKNYIKELLQRKYDITPETIDRWIPFEDPEQLTVREKFDILLFIYRSRYGFGGRALEELVSVYRLDQQKTDDTGGKRYQITAEEIEEIYLDQWKVLGFAEKLEILTQRIFSMNKGNGVVDDLIYQKIDGVSGGVSGPAEESYHSIYIMIRGKSIHLSFLSFESERELRRVCKNIYKFDAPGQMSRSTGFIVNSLKSGARVSDMRPPFASSWTFWIRMFDSVEKRSVEDLFYQEGNKTLAKLLFFLIRGEQTCVISGQQGSGKTTCLEALVDFINPLYNIRTIELTFELQLQKIYPDRNIAAMRETKTVTTEEAIEFVKKTDADVVIFGEIAKETEGEKMVKLSQTGSRFSLFTHHGVSTEAMISWFRNSLLQCSGFHSEKVAEEQVADAIRFNIHLGRGKEGERVIERITEIIRKKDSSGHAYQLQDIMCFEEGEYKLIHPISAPIQWSMQRNMEEKERQGLRELMEGILL